MRSEKRKSVFQVFLQRASTPPGDLELARSGCGAKAWPYFLLLAVLTSPSSPPRQHEDEKILLFISGFLPPAGMCRGPFLVCLSARTSTLFFPNSRVSATVAVCLLDHFLQSGRLQVTDKEKKAHSFIQFVFFSIMDEESTAWTRDFWEVKRWTGGSAALT